MIESVKIMNHYIHKQWIQFTPIDALIFGIIIGVILGVLLDTIYGRIGELK